MEHRLLGQGKYKRSLYEVIQTSVASKLPSDKTQVQTCSPLNKQPRFNGSLNLLLAFNATEITSRIRYDSWY